MPLAALPKIIYSATSAILPGTGELALGKTTQGAIMLGADILVWSSFFALEKEKDNLTDTYKQYDYSHYFTLGLAANHIISAIDAYIMTNQVNRTAITKNDKVKMYYYTDVSNNSLTPTLALRVNF